MRGESGGERATACMCGRNGVLGVEPGTRRRLEGVLAAANAEGDQRGGCSRVRWRRYTAFVRRFLEKEIKHPNPEINNTTLEGSGTACA